MVADGEIAKIAGIGTGMGRETRERVRAGMEDSREIEEIDRNEIDKEFKMPGIELGKEKEEEEDQETVT